MKEQLIVRMNLSSLRRIRKVFYARKDESVASYFERLSKELKKGLRE